jgi:hypothetical protein
MNRAERIHIARSKDRARIEMLASVGAVVSKENKAPVNDAIFKGSFRQVRRSQIGPKKFSLIGEERSCSKVSPREMTNGQTSTRTKRWSPRNKDYVSPYSQRVCRGVLSRSPLAQVKPSETPREEQPT